jgi:sugar lactone lactonase YvrE
MTSTSRGISRHGWSEIVVDGRGNFYVNDIAADGSLSNRPVWADGLAPDGICLDADGCIWTYAAETQECVRVREGGEVLERLGRSLFATRLGGPDRRTLLMLVAEWSGTGGVNDAITRRTGQVLIADVPAPGAGWQ